MQTLLECLGKKLYDEVIEKSVLNLGCGRRLNEIYKKDKIKLAFLGASITCGYHAVADGYGKCFPDFLEEYFREKVGVKDVECRNLAVSGTNCLTGMFVATMIVKDYKPDIVFLEYSINEESDPIGLQKYESLVRLLMKFENPPVIMPVTVFNREGYSCQEYMLHFSRHYGLPMAGIKDSLYPLITSGRLPMNVYTEDTGHPHVDGHEFIAKCIIHTLEESMRENAKEKPLPEAITTAQFENFTLVDLEEAAIGMEKIEFRSDVFPTCHKKEKNGQRLFLETSAECSQFLVLFVKGNTHEFAVAELISDGEKLGGFSGYSLFGWNNPWTELIMVQPEKKLRNIQLRTEKGDENKELYLFGAAYC